MKTLISIWNLDFTRNRRANLRRAIRLNLHLQPTGKGNRAWKRVESNRRELGTIIWPDYAT